MTSPMSAEELAFLRVSFLNSGPNMWFYAQATADQFIYFLVPPHLGVQAYRMDSNHLREINERLAAETVLLEIFVVGDSAQDILVALAARIQYELNATTRKSTRDKGYTVFRVTVAQVATVEELPSGGARHELDREHMRYGKTGALEAVDVWGGTA